jgi:hypothetical protein
LTPAKGILTRKRLCFSCEGWFSLSPQSSSVLEFKKNFKDETEQLRDFVGVDGRRRGHIGGRCCVLSGANRAFFVRLNSIRSSFHLSALMRRNRFLGRQQYKLVTFYVSGFV